MKNPDRATVPRLEDLPNVGPAVAGDLRLLGIAHPRQIPGRDPLALYDELCAATGERQDPCVLDVFLAVVDFMEGGAARPWWDYTAHRKRMLAAEGRVL